MSEKKIPLHGSFYTRNQFSRIDLEPLADPTVYAPADGTVLFAGYDLTGVKGNYLKILEEDGTLHLLGGLDTFADTLVKNMQVNKGDTLGSLARLPNGKWASLHYERIGKDGCPYTCGE